MEAIENRVITALDFPTRNDVHEFIGLFQNEPLSVKVGMELFYRNGPAVVSDLKNRGFGVFLDLKLHDIPNTVKRAMKGLAVLGVDMINVHAGGGRTMMEAALEGLDQGTASGKDRPICIAVTQLTSTTQEMMRDELLISGTLEKVVASYAKTAQSAGLDGVVCSPLESQAIKLVCGQRFLTVTPGIRLTEDSANDQARFTTPAEARKRGSDYIVVGRSITKAEDPVKAYEQVQKEWRDGNE